jgi:putative endonuclease
VREFRGWVYILTNRANGTPRIGVTSDLVRRVFEQRAGLMEGFSRRYGLKRPRHFERHEDVRAAIQREKNIRHWSRARKVGLILRANPQWLDPCYEIVKR